MHELKFILGYFPILETCTFVFSNGRFHSGECAFKHFVCDGSQPINLTCSNLADDSNLKKIIQRAQLKEEDLSHHNFVYRTYSQMKTKMDRLLRENSIKRLQKYKVNFKLEKLNRTLSLYKRFVVQISANNIPRLKNLVQVALRNNRSISSILDKCTEAVADVYRARPSQDDRDLAFLVLKFGGPSLLSILHQANVLPSVSLAYRISQNSHQLSSSVTLSFRQCCEENLGPLKKMQQQDEALMFSYSIKCDETFVNPRLRYNSRNNEMVGVCYEHQSKVKLKFDSMIEVNALQEKWKNDEIHVPKECMVTGISSLVKNIPFQVILMWPTCSKNDFQGSCEMYVSISDSMKDILGAPAQNFNSDGDSTRRKALHAITNNNLDLTSELGKTMTQLMFVDLNVGRNNETINFDVKHLAKRCWTSLISDKLQVNSVTLTKKDISAILKLSERRTHDINTLVYPNDKQNVPLASDTLLSFIQVVTDTEKQKRIPLKLIPVIPDLVMLASIYDAIMCLYSYVNFSLTDQITTIAKAAVTLLVLIRESRLEIPAQLYHDIQCSFIDTVFCVAKLQINSPGASFYTALNGTDPEERYFGNVRMAMGHKNMDAYELMNIASSISKCDDVFIRHPEWVRKSQLSRRLVLDHSNTKDWKGDLVVSHVNLLTAWKLGILEAQKLCVKAAIAFDPEHISTMGITLRKPKGKIIGVAEKDFDWSTVRVDEGNVGEASGPSSEGDTDLNEFIDVASATSVNYLNVDGKNVFKSSILKELNKDTPLSNDRLRKVRGLSKFCGESDTSVNVDDIISIGDPLVICQSNKLEIGIVTSLKDGNVAVRYLARTDLEHISTKVQVRELEMIEVGNNIFTTGKYTSHPVWISGRDTICIEPEVSIDPPQGCSAFYFDKQLIQDVGVHISLCDVDHTSATSSDNMMRKCKVKGCRKMVTLSNMRKHVGKHILNKEVQKSERLCGFCGAEGCSTNLKKSNKGKKLFFTPERGGCTYFWPYVKIGDDATRNVPCTNKLKHCPACNVVIWTYNLHFHYENQHPELQNVYRISDREHEIMNKLKV